MKKKSLRNFNPKIVAKIETKMWKAYYEKKFIRLFFLYTNYANSFFGMGLVDSIYSGYFAYRATKIFSVNRHNEPAEKILFYLVKFFNVVKKHSIEEFDPKQIATRELKWWFVDRYPENFSISRDEAIADTLAPIFEIKADYLMKYAHNRAFAMTLYDRSEESQKVADWDRIEHFLHKAFACLYRSVN